MTDQTVEFTVEVTDEQRLLNGLRYVSLEGASESQDWTLAVSFGQAKEPGAPIVEGDLTLNGPAGDIFGELDKGRIWHEADDLSDMDRELFDCSFRVEGGEGRYAAAAGQVRIRGELSGSEGRLRAWIELNA